MFKKFTGWPWSRCAYLKSNLDLLGEGALREDGLDLGDDGAVDDAALRPDGVDLLPDPADDGEVLREVGGEDARDAVGVEVLDLVHLVGVEGLLQHVLHGVLRRLQRVLLPRLAVVRAQDHDLALLVAQRREVRHLDDDRPARREIRGLIPKPRK